jgi:adenosylhomocysteine nucleosidase
MSGETDTATGLVAAFSWEIRGLLRSQKHLKKDGRFFSLVLADRSMKLVVAGVGARNSYQAARDLIDRFGVGSIATIGFAGALIDSLAVGDIVVADRVLDQQTGETFNCGREPWSLAAARRGTLFCASEVITSTSEKRRLAEHWGAIAVDMESAGVARAAAERGIDFSAVKAITDTSGQSISIDFARCRSDDKGFSLRKIVAEGIRSPHGIRDLWMLATGARVAARALAAALCAPGMMR